MAKPGLYYIAQSHHLSHRTERGGRGGSDVIHNRSTMCSKDIRPSDRAASRLETVGWKRLLTLMSSSARAEDGCQGELQARYPPRLYRGPPFLPAFSEAGARAAADRWSADGTMTGSKIVHAIQDRMLRRRGNAHNVRSLFDEFSQEVGELAWSFGEEQVPGENVFARQHGGGADHRTGRRTLAKAALYTHSDVGNVGGAQGTLNLFSAHGMRMGQAHKVKPRRRSLHEIEWSGVWHRLRVQAHRPPLPIILFANVQSLENKLDDIQSGILQTTVSVEGGKEKVQRQSGGADGAARHQMPMARAMDYYGLPGQNPLNCEYRRIPSGPSELILCIVRGEQQHR